MTPEPDDEQRLLRQHVKVLFEMDGDGALIRANEPDGEAAPRIFLARGRRWHELRSGLDVPPSTAERCREVAAVLPRWDGRATEPAVFEPLRVVLREVAPITAESAGPAFRFGDRVDVPGGPQATAIDARRAHLLARYFPYTRSVLAACSPVVGVILDGSVVSACFSARRRPGACEAGVATEEPYRGRGLGPVVVSAWRDAVEREGRQPLYSTSWDNAASLAVARKLRLIAYAETLSLE